MRFFKTSKEMIRYTALTILVLSILAKSAFGVKIADITHIQGQRENTLMTIGLVVGLNGTGDGGKFMPAIKPLASFLNHMGDPIMDSSELKDTKNVALVSVEAVIGQNGAREGQAIDITVSAIGSAKSLKGGRLLLTPLLGPNKADQTIYALARGPVFVDATNPTTGMVKNGATMEVDVINNFIQENTLTLVVNDSHASWSMASTIAMTINEAVSVQHTQQQSAQAMDPKNVIVMIPQNEQRDPARFIAWIQSLPLLMPEKVAQVTINSRTGTIVSDGNVTISPVTISYRGITLSTETLVKKLKDEAEKKNQVFEMPEYLDLNLLIDAMNVLAIPVDDRISIIRELARSGNLQGQLVEQL
jgi:flagellar P-ring protein precursor FlgI